MAPRKYVHSLLILSEITIIVCCLIMIIKYDRTGWNEKIWMGSKILTLKKEMRINNYELFPILNIYSENNKTVYNQNYKAILNNLNKYCEEENYKVCGVIDTCGNKMCIPKEDECPINEIVVDLISKENDYTNQGYHIAHLNNLTEGYVVYYTNTKTDNEIIVKIKFSDEIPKIINKDNFIFDEDLYESSQSSSDGYYGSGTDGGGYDGGGGGGDVGSGGGGFRNLEEVYGDSDVTKYINKKFNEEINIDKSYKKVYNNFYVGNYIGYTDINNMNDYNRMDLYESYLTVFPNVAAVVFCYISIVIFIGLIIFSIIRFCHKDIPNEGFDPCCVLFAKLSIIIPYLIIFIGYFAYLIYEYFNIYKNRDPEKLIKVKADSFIEHFLSEIYDRHLKERFILSIIILFSCSMLIFIVAWIFSYIFTKKYLKRLNIANSCNSSTE